MYGIKNNNGKTIRGMWTNLLDARAKACQYSHLDNYVWKVVSGELVLCQYQNGKEIIQDLSKEERELATAIHGKLCRYNHEDQCDWFYGDRWTEEFSAKHEYLKKARAMLDNGVEFEQAMKVITNL
jgi:hypothetical protein